MRNRSSPTWLRSPVAAIVAAAALSIGAPAAARAQNAEYTFTRIADTVHDNPGLGGVSCVGLNDRGTVIVRFQGQLWRGDGQSFALVGTPGSLCASINDLDEIAYVLPNYPIMSVSSLVKNSGGTLTILARTDVAPFLFLGDTYLPSLNNSGNAVYQSRGLPGPGTNAGIYIGPAGTAVYNVTTDPPLLGFSTASMNDSNTVVFSAIRVVQGQSRLGVYRGSAVPLVETGQSTSVGIISVGLERPVINGSGTVAFEGAAGGSSSNLYTTSDGTTLALVGTASIQRLALNDSGTVAYRRVVQRGGSQGSGLFVGRPGLIDQKIVGNGDPLDGSTVTETFLWEEAINSSGQIAFWAHLADGRQGVYRANPLPVLTSLSPSSAAVGGPAFTLTVNGRHFVSGSQVRWNGSPRPTTYLNDGELQASIPASDLAAGGTAFVTVVNPAPIAATSNALPFTIVPTMALSKTTLTFGAVTSGTAFLFQTSPQLVRLTQTGIGAVTWTAAANQPWLQVSPASGSGSGTLSIGVVFTAGLPSSGTLTGTITLTFTGAANSPGPITVKLNLLSATSQKPFGVVDTPIDGRTGVTGAVPFTGWALDDIELARVMICRDAVPGEVAPVDPNCAGTAQIFVGFAVFIDLARPDVAAQFPEIPLNTRAGWGFMVLTNMLPDVPAAKPGGGNGRFVFYMWAQDKEGNTQLLGTRTITCDNAHATLPFGAIDTPTQGGAATGANYVNFGWALTPAPKSIPIDGSTIRVLVDGVDVGTADYNHFRPDIAQLFPGYANSTGAIGFKVIDTTTMADGVHTIVWVVSDDAGSVEGIGSRFFSVSNGAGALASAAEVSSRAVSRRGRESGDGGARAFAIAAAPLDTTPVLARRGWDLEGAWQAHGVGGGGRAVIRGEELERIELALGEEAGERYSAHLRVGGELSALPVGTTFDPTTGAFAWAPGVGFVGTYDLVFVRWSGDRAAARREVRVILAPKGRRR